MKKMFLFEKRGMVLLLLAVVAATYSISASGMATKLYKVPHPFTKDGISFAHLTPQPDSISIAILGEEVAMIVFNAKKATLSHLNPMEPPIDGEVTIGGVQVVKQLGTLNKCDLNVIQFLMADSVFYNRGPISATSPYAPNYALTFTKGKQRVDLVFSLQSCEVGVVLNGKLTKVNRYYNSREITRFFRLLSQNEFYDKVIEQQ